MSNPLLVAVGNATPFTVALVSTNGNGSDNLTIAPYTVGFTGGKDHNNIQIPECSGEQWYNDHHILMTATDLNGAQQWQIAVWANDVNNAVLYWNDTNAYSEQHPLSGTGGGQVISTLYIGTNPNGALFVNPTSVQT